MIEQIWPNDWAERLSLIGNIGAAVIIVLLPLELWRRQRAGRLTKEAAKEMLASASPLLPLLLLGGLLLAGFGWIYGAVASLAPFTIPTNGWTALAAVVLVDFLYYWDHRCGHRLRTYWAIGHSVHHSSPQYDQTVGLRVSVLEGLFSPWFYLPAVLVGFDPLLVVAAFGVILGYQQWLHTELVGRLPWLDGWLGTPSNHRVHHGAQPQYIDRNYGAILIVWDRLFGTYAAEDEPVRYGLTTPIGSTHPWRVHTFEAARLWRELTAARGWRERLRTLVVMPPVPCREPVVVGARLLARGRHERPSRV